MDNPGYLGGAELTMAEFWAAAPEGVEVVECRPGEVIPDMDRYVVGNCMTYPELPANAIRYHHDINRAPADRDDAKHIFVSPLQRRSMLGYQTGGHLIPPAIDLERFKPPGSWAHSTPVAGRKGAVCVGRMAYGKGLELLAEYEEPVDVYSSVPFRSEGNARYQGIAKDVPGILSRYERFVFLPTALEPFGRAVVEAWAAGLELVVNKNVGSRYWIEEQPERLRTASEDFWRLVTS